MLFLGIGYAQISSIDLLVNGNAQLKKQTGIVITDVEYKSSNNADNVHSIINNYYQTNLDSTIVLNNSNDSSITYQVTIKNLGDTSKQYVDTVYDSSFYDNDEITFELNGLTTDVILDKNDTLTFDITFYFKEDKESYSNTVLNSYLKYLVHPMLLPIMQMVAILEMLLYF